MLRRPILVLSPAVWIHRLHRRGVINPRVALLTRGCGHLWLMFGYVSSLLCSSHGTNLAEIYLTIAGYYMSLTYYKFVFIIDQGTYNCFFFGIELLVFSSLMDGPA